LLSTIDDRFHYPSIPTVPKGDKRDGIAQSSFSRA